MLRWVFWGYIIGGHAMATVGCYLVASRIDLLSESSATGANLFPLLFTGLMLIVGSFCLFGNAVGMFIKGKFRWWR